jgi:hypothetical protein
MRRLDHAAIRLAAQTITALRAGARIESASIENGVELAWPTIGASEWDRDRETAARIDILLAGIAAFQRYSFGLPPFESGALLLEPRFDDPIPLDDLAAAEVLARHFDHRAASTLEWRKRRMASLIYKPLFWHRIEQLADALLCGPQNHYRIASHGDFGAAAMVPINVHAIARSGPHRQASAGDARPHAIRALGPREIAPHHTSRPAGFSGAKMLCRYDRLPAAPHSRS